ncbi:hypothetical protein [Streptomyces sp. WAC 01420]|uniref:hypothetical protein n=1 Tax=Streptomyces sp. WAC 01420 TaxID=2203203 RepID=UPI0026D6E2BB|nr:hypothetical protein [Streptomyces sp. WAC 01420]
MVPRRAGPASGGSSSAATQYWLRDGSSGRVARLGLCITGVVDQYASPGASGSTMPVIRTASGSRSTAGTWRTEPTSMFSFRAVSLLTAASTAVVPAVTSFGARGSRPAADRECRSSPLWAMRWNCGGTPSGRDSHGSGTSTRWVVRTP